MLEQRVEKAIGILNARAAPLDETPNYKSDKTQIAGQNLHCRPRNLADYTKRLESFSSITKWFAKPEEIGPLECARFGWILVDLDVLKCESCNSRLMFRAPTSASAADLKALGERFKLELNNSHKLLCPWRDNPSPQSFASCPAAMGARNEALVNFDAALKSFLPADENSLALARDFVEEHNFRSDGELREEVLETAAARVLSDADLDDMSTTNRYWRNAVICALFGWERDTKTSVLSCVTCKRRVGLWNLICVRSVEREGIAAEGAASPSSTGAASTANTDTSISGPLSPQHKRTKLGGSYFHPAREHRWFCPWIGGSRVGWRSLIQLLHSDASEATRVGPVTAVLQGLKALS